LDTLSKLGLEAYRLRLLRGLDDQLRGLGWSRVAGVDEAGRGCLAGPVVAAAVIVDVESCLPGVDDSKKLRADDRTRLSRQIKDTAVAWKVGLATPAEIDRLNILEATRLAMRRAVSGLVPGPDCALVDVPCLSLVRGDIISYSVACASILAKAERDLLMRELDLKYPHYGFSRHKGYAAEEHRRALVAHGPSPEHRLTFRSVVPRGAEVRH
jgi:ribonuclease HII